MQFSEQEFNDLCKSSVEDLHCLPTFMIVLEFIRFLQRQGNTTVSSTELASLFLKAGLISPDDLSSIKPSPNQIERSIRNLIERRWLEVDEISKGVYRINRILFPRERSK